MPCIEWCILNIGCRLSLDFCEMLCVKRLGDDIESKYCCWVDYQVNIAEGLSQARRKFGCARICAICMHRFVQRLPGGRLYINLVGSTYIKPRLYEILDGIGRNPSLTDRKLKLTK